MTSDGVGKKEGRMPAALNGTIASSSGLHCSTEKEEERRKKGAAYRKRYIKRNA